MAAPVIADLSEVLLGLGLADSATDTQKALAAQALVSAAGAIKRFLRYDPVQAERVEYYPQHDFARAGQTEVWEVSDTAAYIRRLSGAVSSELQLTHLPVRSITELRIDYDGRAGSRAGSFATGTIKTEGTDFWPNWDSKDSAGAKVCKDGIIRSQGRWPDTAGSVMITYVAGYTDAELHGQDSILDASPILEALLDETTRRFLKVVNRGKRRVAGFAGPLASESMGDYSYSVDTATMAKLIGGGTDLLAESEQKLQPFQRMDWGVA